MTAKPLKKQPKQRRSQEIVTSLLQGATRVLSARRLRETTTAAIANAAGVGIGSLYDYFPNKQSIAVALIDHHIEKITADYRALLEKCDHESMNEVIDLSLNFIFSDIFERRAFLHEIFLLLPESGRMESLLRARAVSAASLEAFLIRRWPEKGAAWAHLKAFMAIVAVLGIAENYIMLEETAITPDEVLSEIRSLLKALFNVE